MSEAEGLVTSLSSEGQGILRQDNFVVFVPFTAPGDTIRYRITHRKKNFAQGELIKVLHPSPERTLPLCRYYGLCGGCQLQHMTYEAQLKSKHQIVEEAFKRIGKFTQTKVEPVVPAQLNWAYRRHITLKIYPDGDFLAAGYTAVDNQSLINVEHCPIFIPESDPAIQEVQTLLKNFSAKGFSNGSAVLFKAETDQLILCLHFEGTNVFKPEMIDNFLKQHPHWIGMIIHSKDKTSSWGTTKAIIKIDEMRFACSPDVFTQNHPEQSMKIYRQISNMMSSYPGARIMDLYCGIGISSLLLAKQGHQVIGVEYNHESIAFARENAQINGLATPQFIQGDVEQVLHKKLKKEAADWIIINPPRVGITPQVVHEILRRKPQGIIYVSCMPSTLARDLQMLCSQEYKISLVQPYDMFPQTSHVETLVQLN